MTRQRKAPGKTAVTPIPKTPDRKSAPVEVTVEQPGIEGASSAWEVESPRGEVRRFWTARLAREWLVEEKKKTRGPGRTVRTAIGRVARSAELLGKVTVSLGRYAETRDEYRPAAEIAGQCSVAVAELVVLLEKLSGCGSKS